MSNFEYDLIVIGAGPGGYVSAIRATQLGMKTAIIEKDKLGGVCLNIGCIPSKSLIHQAESFRSISELEEMGITVDKSGFNYKKVFEKSRKTADTLSKGVQFLMKKNKIDVITGTAKLDSKNTIILEDGRKITAKNILIATGSRPKVIPGFEFDEEKVLSSTGALMLEELPKKVIILGSGAIGVEFAHIFRSFGCEVHIVELLDRIIPLEDPEVSDTLAKAFKKRKINIYTSTMAKSMIKTETGVEVTIEKDGKESVITADKILVAVGRTPNTDNIGLENIGITTERGFIPVGDYYLTSAEGIYAIGDVVNSPLLAHVASKEGEIAVEHMAGHAKEKKIDPTTIPGAIYCEPQVASFGYNEEKAIKEGLTFAKATFPYRGAGKSVAVEKPDGLIKIIFNPETKKILGASMIGAEATEMIHEVLLARTAELLPEDIATMIHAHPTLSEVVMEGMRAVEGWAIHA